MKAYMLYKIIPPNILNIRAC